MLNNPFLFKWDPSLTIKNSNYGKKAEENPVAIFWEPKDLTQEAGDHIPFWGSESLIEAQEESTQPQFYITTGKPRSVIAGLIYDDTQMAYYYIFPAKEEEKDLGT